MLKKRFSVALVAIMILMSIVPTFAESYTSKSKLTIINVPKNEIRKNEQSQIDAEMLEISKANLNNNTQDISIRSSTGYDYKNELIATKTVSKVPIGFAANQPSNGTVFASTGGFFWQDGGNNVSLSLSVGLAYGPVSVSVSASPGSSSNTGSYIQSPWINKPVKLFIYKDIQVSQYKAYRKARMGNGGWEYIRTFETSTPTTNYLEVKKI